MRRWELIGSERLIKSPWVSIEKNSYRINEERTITDYYVFRRSPFVLVVAQHDENVLLVRQYRPATDRFYLAVPAGYIENGEEVIAAAYRELLEETGSKGTEFTIIGTLDPLPGYIHSQASIVWCRCVTPPNGQRGNGEVLAVESHSWSTVAKMILSGTIDEMQTASALLLAKEWLSSS